MNEIKQIYYESRRIYGSVKVWNSLVKKGIKVSQSWVTKLMHQMGLKSKTVRKYVHTTESGHGLSVAENKLDRKFRVQDIGKVWVSDITFLRVKNDWKYLTTILDLGDRKVVGYQISDTMKTEDTIIKAWSNAINYRAIKPGFIFHSDRGVQYASKKFVSILEHLPDATQSMSRKGNCWDNAVAESFFKSLKYECAYHHKFESTEELQNVIHRYIHWYNYDRIHSTIDFMTPAEKEKELTFKYYSKTA